MLSVVEEMMPGFIRNVVWQECATPLTQERFTLSSGGTSYGLEHTPDQYMAARVALQTEIPGLWMVGANALFGHGIAGAHDERPGGGGGHPRPGALAGRQPVGGVGLWPQVSAPSMALLRAYR